MDIHHHYYDITSVDLGSIKCSFGSTRFHRPLESLALCNILGGGVIFYSIILFWLFLSTLMSILEVLLSTLNNEYYPQQYENLFRSLYENKPLPDAHHKQRTIIQFSSYMNYAPLIPDAANLNLFNHQLWLDIIHPMCLLFTQHSKRRWIRSIISVGLKCVLLLLP